MTDQEIFDQALNGIRAQGCRAMEVTGEVGSTPLCRYRTKTGARCAAGQFIPVAEYRPEMERQGFGCLYKDRKLGACLRAVITEDQTALVQTLQHVHDRGYGSEWYKRYVEEGRRPESLPAHTPIYTLASEKLSALPPAEQEVIVEEAFAALAVARGLTYTRQPWAQPAVG